MNKVRKFFLFCTLMLPGICFLCSALAQSHVKKSANFDFLKEDSVLNVIYNYDSLYVGELVEDDYIDKKTNGGQDQSWISNWLDDRKIYYQPNFEKALSKQLKDLGLRAHASAPHARYTILVKTKFIEPGFWIVNVQKKAEIRVDYLFFKTSAPDTILAIVHGWAFGRGPHNAYRVGKAYFGAGRALGKYILKYISEIKQ